MSNRAGKTRSWCSLILLGGLASAACAGEPLDDDVGETASATDPWGWCVDYLIHPCPNLEAVGYGGCPFASGLLLLGVKNVGNLTAIPTKTSVTFYGKTKLETTIRTIDTESLKPGETAAYWTPAPTSWVAGCTAAVCRWKVTADSTDLINEVDGTNNHRSGTCWFPE